MKNGGSPVRINFAHSSQDLWVNAVNDRLHGEGNVSFFPLLLLVALQMWPYFKELMKMSDLSYDCFSRTGGAG